MSRVRYTVVTRPPLDDATEVIQVAPLSESAVEAIMQGQLPLGLDFAAARVLDSRSEVQATPTGRMVWGLASGEARSRFAPRRGLPSAPVRRPRRRAARREVRRARRAAVGRAGPEPPPSIAEIAQALAIDASLSHRRDAFDGRGREVLAIGTGGDCGRRRLAPSRQVGGLLCAADDNRTPTSVDACGGLIGDAATSVPDPPAETKSSKREECRSTAETPGPNAMPDEDLAARESRRARLRPFVSAMADLLVAHLGKKR